MNFRSNRPSTWDLILLRYLLLSYTGIIKYFRNIGNGVFFGIGEDKIITCKQNFTDIELNEKYSISFFGGFRAVSLKSDFISN